MSMIVGLWLTATALAGSTPRAECAGLGVVLAFEHMAQEELTPHCQALLEYVTTAGGVRPPAREMEQRLRDSGVASEAVCVAVNEDEARCRVEPRPIVREVEIEGDLPMGLLRADLRRRLYLRPGVLLDTGEEQLREQGERLQAFLSAEGYFSSLVSLVTQAIGGAAPNLGVRVVVQVVVGGTGSLRRVRIEGHLPEPVRHLTERVRHEGLFGLFASRFRPAQLDEDVEEIVAALKEHGYPEARVRGEYVWVPGDAAVDVVLHAEAGPLLELEFRGNQRLDNDELIGVTTFWDAGVIDALEIERSAEAIRTLYQRHGHYDAKVVLRVGERGPVMRISGTIDEGPRAAIEKVVFVGNEALSDAQLRRQAQLLTKDSGLFSEGYWVDVDIAYDRGAIAGAYRGRGYPGVQVDVHRELDDAGNMRVVFTIDEGLPQRVASITLTGVPPELHGILLLRLRSRSAGPYVDSRVEADERRLASSLAELGYLQAEVHTTVSEDAAGVHLTFAIELGARAIFGGVLVRGAFRSEDDLIIDQLDLERGEPLDAAAVGEARLRLLELGVFGAVGLTPVPPPETVGPTWLVAGLEERDQRGIDGVLTFATDELFTVGADYRDRNVFGRAVRLDVQLRLANASEWLPEQVRIGNVDRAQVVLRAPEPFDFPADVETAAGYDLEDKKLFFERRVGATVRLLRELVEPTMCARCPNVSSSLGYELIGSEFRASAAVEETARILLRETGTFARIVPQLTVETRDSPVDPQRGLRLENRFELAEPIFALGLAEAAAFARVIIAGQGYVRLVRNWNAGPHRSRFGGPIVLALGATYGAAQPLGGARTLPSSETFYYGGDARVRGLDDRASTTVTPGARHLFSGTLEVRFYLLRDFGIGSVQVAGFADYGSVSYEIDALMRQRTVSVGPALRYVTPVGPISLAYGRPVILPRGLVSGGRLHFSFGYSF